LVAGDGAGPNAEERVAPQPLPLLGALQQEGALGRAKLEEGRDGGLEIGDEGMGYGYDVMS
jgi:hypothetical protein